MARYSSGVLTTAGSTTLPIISVYSIAAVSPIVREVGLTNVTAVPVALAMKILTSAATQGAGQVESKHRDGSPVASCTVFTTHTAGTPIGSDLGPRTTLAAAIGSGVIWTFGETGISPAVGTANGIGVAVENGTGQACQAYLTWDE